MVKKLLTHGIQKFIQVESFSGLLLFGATILAIVWANSPWGYLYESLWGYELGVQVTKFELIKPLILWVNDGLMAIFFFLIGLEIKRELMVGELNSAKKAVFPVLAAIGGIALPGLIFVFLNGNPETLKGWAIPMATDIAFSLAIIKLLGDRVPLNAKIFLTALAIVDDLGAVMIIAIFYSTGIKWTLILIAMGLLAVLYVLSYRDLFSKHLLLLVGIAVWTLFLKAGIHPTIAGVLLAFAVPIRQKMRFSDFAASLDDITNRLRLTNDPDSSVLTDQQIGYIDELDEWTNEVQSPLQYLEHKLHDWVAYLIMPIFALANAGVTLSAGSSLNLNLVLTIAAALVIGKSLGIFGMSKVALATGVSTLPEGVSQRQIWGVSLLAGVGFTMAIFIANLAFRDNPTMLDSAKIGILIGSLLAGFLGYLILRASAHRGNPDESSVTS
ncbi:Na+/H+ antiporter NhaA [Lewinella sp. W8]|uniref:Na+/H+ antiporter NhaA n=1 Tax=Lewinella sp. W8 TaxID=2528208 RepID=UPI001067740B|nr:Na+/H+ antiporter NhaA [Lewinella sp. W8]MTB53296.1 Na+/H+ antiporter NhaA [Lewinella sp. W8]